MIREQARRELNTLYAYRRLYNLPRPGTTPETISDLELALEAELAKLWKLGQEGKLGDYFEADPEDQDLIDKLLTDDDEDPWEQVDFLDLAEE